MDRVYSIYKKMHFSKSKMIRRLYHFWLRTVYACDIMPQTVIGNGTRFPHNGLGVVINQDAVIGENCVIGKGVVIGGRSGIAVVPRICDDVEIGANAVVIGPVTIGEGAKIGAGSVVVHDVEPYAVVAGNPAADKKNAKAGKKDD